jgi:deazaflavin-dependent oxidoreductase (nitroreductase family)
MVRAGWHCTRSGGPETSDTGRVSGIRRNERAEGASDRGSAFVPDQTDLQSEVDARAKLKLRLAEWKTRVNRTVPYCDRRQKAESDDETDSRDANVDYLAPLDTLPVAVAHLESGGSVLIGKTPISHSSNDTLKDRLARYRQIKISVIGRKSGRTISIPVWFVSEAEKLYLLPVKGSDTQWYSNVLKNPSIRIDARGFEAEFRATPVTDAKAVKSVIERFREKYGPQDVKKYYSGFDVAVVVKIG